MRAWFVSFVVHLGPSGYSAYGPAAAPAWPGKRPRNLAAMVRKGQRVGIVALIIFQSLHGLRPCCERLFKQHLDA
ncbi:uncharacterized protein ASPGLDRAFT_944698 [Aspergillus glaucus CBS 516.65]|uniref:Uncharacterized protein n=1 Tax=Aspergillus glaucus CBS 516.65 TaxID=1160497 RepID=A0A1L9V6L6_ASPGL|nr:hypothetical protein ASPGLDRAFT_944698 [Aspergillus glaucus CBS 516.65]OJJ79577.1 hypothetical protein ASPGLDRAFT_944698 [Aspergillus glaucus CBS 516.65]